jgi:SNF2 family DNA or RNA helicase
LTSPKVTAADLAFGDWDFVICSYHFVLAQYRRLKQFNMFVEAVEMNGKDAAKKQAKLNRWPTERPTLSLFSDLYTLLNRPIRHLILDEVQVVKNIRGKLHEAVKQLPYASIIMLSGTIFHNRWQDIFGALDLLKKEPFDGIDDLERVFCDPYDERAEVPLPSRFDRLVKQLMSFTIGRPTTMLDLKPMKCVDSYFFLDIEDVAAISELVDVFITLMQGADATSATRRDRAILHATLAALRAAHPLLTNYQLDSARSILVKQELEKLHQLFIERVSSLESTEGSNLPEWYLLEQDRGVDIATEPTSQQDLTRAAMYMQRFIKWKKDKREQAYRAAVLASVRADSQDAVEACLIEAREDADAAEIQDDCDYGEEDEDENEGHAEIREAQKAKLEAWKKRVKHMNNMEILSPRVRCFLKMYEIIRVAFETEKVLVFSPYLKFLFILEEAIIRCYPGQGVRILRYDGTMSAVDRQIALENFQAAPPSAVMLMTPGAGGAGLNITCASILILCQALWNSNDEDQIKARIHRQGQEREVHIFRLVAANSPIDWLMINAQERKRSVIREFMGRLQRTDEIPPDIPLIVPAHADLAEAPGAVTS